MPWDADLEGTLEMQAWIGLQYCRRWNLWFDSFFKWWCRYSFIEILFFFFFISSLNKADQIFSPPYGTQLYQSCKYTLVFRYGWSHSSVGKTSLGANFHIMKDRQCSSAEHLAGASGNQNTWLCPAPCYSPGPVPHPFSAFIHSSVKWL